MDTLADFVKTLAKKVQFKATRIDLAWDGLDFSPSELSEYIEANMHNRDNFRSTAKRETISIRRDPAKPDDKGNIGTSSITLGSRQSTRMLRVYDLHGFTRLEFQIMKERAQYILMDMSFRDAQERYQIGLSHLLDYIDLSWDKWRDFVGSTKRAELTLNDAREITEKRLKMWLQKQVAPALSAIQDAESNYVVKLLAHGRVRDRSKYQALLEPRRIKD
jgi:DNA relaxase NicK